MSAPAPRPAPDADGWVVSRPRHELKYAGPAEHAASMERLLGALTAPDPQYPEDRVHSVYFDTRRLAAYEDKAAGQYLKEKVRLRWYGAGGEAWLEVKRRTGSVGTKHRKRVAFAAPEVPDEEAFAALARRHLGVALRPSLWIAYRRIRRVAAGGALRVALDRDVRTLWVSPAVARRRPPGALPWFVVEVKGDAPEPPPWLSRAIGRFARREAVSKYGLCVEQVRGGYA